MNKIGLVVLAAILTPIGALAQPMKVRRSFAK